MLPNADVHSACPVDTSVSVTASGVGITEPGKPAGRAGRRDLDESGHGPISLATANHYTVNTAANGIALPGGSHAAFIQTIPGDSIPHLIEFAAIDPFTGGNVAFGSGAPAEGIGVYRVAAAAPFRAASSLTTTISAPAVIPAAAQPVFLPPLGSDNNAVTLSGSLNFSRAQRFDNGFLVVSHSGRVIDVRDLSTVLPGASSSLNFSDTGLPLPAFNPSLDVSVRLWNSSDPAGTLTRAALTAPVDVSSGGAGGLILTVP